jgi:hypothetical protein
MDLVRELHKNKGLSGFDDLKDGGRHQKNPLIESQETRKMELSMDPSMSNSVARFRDDDTESFINHSGVTSQLSFGVHKHPEGHSEIVKDSKLPKSPATSYG